MKGKGSILFAGVLAILCTVGCHKTDSFTVQGSIEGASGQTLYLENLGVNAISIVDSVKLGEDGSFSFTQPSAPMFDFYRLRLGRQVINLVIDSTETVTVNASQPTMQTGYTVQGSEDSQRLKELVMDQIGLQQELKQITSDTQGMTLTTLRERVNETIGNFKTRIKNNYVLNDPASPLAYYALFSSIDGTKLFDVMGDRQDAKCYAAVATSLDLKYPDQPRTRHLKNVALKGMKATAPVRPASDETIDMLSQITVTTGLIDIALPDVNENVKRLSDLKGKVVLLDFTAFKTSYSAEYTLMLRGLYSKFAELGFEIYQVSFDADKHFWQTGASNLPWITVHDEDALDSKYISSYRVEALPTAFLISREGEVELRVTDVKNLESDISSLLGL